MLKIITPVFMVFILVLVAGCSPQSKKERTFLDYMREDDFAAERYKVPTKHEKEEACSLIQNDIKKLQPGIGSSDESIREEAARKLKWLRGHARRFDCDIEYNDISVTGSDSSTPDAQKKRDEEKHVAVPAATHKKMPDAEVIKNKHAAESATVRDVRPVTGSSLSFNECFDKCKELTSRTNEECFDTCLSR